MAKRRDDFVFLEDMLDCIEKIEEYTEGVTESEFESNVEKQDAVIRRIEVMGEAVKNLSKEIRDQHPEVPWREVAGMRDIVIHQYFGVTIGLIWRVTVSDIPILKEQISRIANDLKA